MNTPICDFVNNYMQSSPMRLHMPGHKGTNILGCESLDITEISGADSLFEASGIIKESEDNASKLFGCKTFYSAEGSSLCIRAMLYLALLNAKENNLSNTILAGRNAHKTFLSAAALLDLDIQWLYSHKENSYLCCNISAKELEDALLKCDKKPMAVYITSPDYLGNISDVYALSKICRKHNVLLLVDNAHGAYLKFLQESQHPIDLGADMCCDSAHKTLPVLTGGAYLHIANNSQALISANAKDAMALFASTSPSYLILQSLDRANSYINNNYRKKLEETCRKVAHLKEKLVKNGYTLCGNEALKITIQTKLYGYSGTEFADILQQHNVHCEFSDSDFVVFMFTPECTADTFNKLEDTFTSLPTRDADHSLPPSLSPTQAVLSPREALFSPIEIVPVSQSEGRVLACTNISCPPAVPIVVCGEKISSQAVQLFEYYGIKTCKVIKE